MVQFIPEYLQHKNFIIPTLNQQANMPRYMQATPSPYNFLPPANEQATTTVPYITPGQEEDEEQLGPRLKIMILKIYNHVGCHDS